VKRCQWCKEMLPLSSFWRNVKKPDGKQDGCIDCHRKRGCSPSTRLGTSTVRRPRRSPYANMGDVLRQIELALNRGDCGMAQERINDARAKYRIVG
jgi:hypothetical protein